MNAETRALLAWALTSVGGGALVYKTVDLIVKLRPRTTPDTRFYLAMVLAFVYPILAYSGQVLLGLVALTPDGALLAMTVAYMISQGIHRQVTRTETP